MPGKRRCGGVFVEQAAGVGPESQGYFRKYGHDALQGLFEYL